MRSCRPTARSPGSTAQRIIEVRAKYDEDQGLTGILNATQAIVEQDVPRRATRGQRARRRCARLRLRTGVRQPGRLRRARRCRHGGAVADAAADHDPVPIAGTVAADLPGDPVQLPRRVRRAVGHRQPAVVPGGRRVHRADRRRRQQHDPAGRLGEPAPTRGRIGRRGDPVRRSPAGSGRWLRPP